jgi:hypothetical protein
MPAQGPARRSSQFTGDDGSTGSDHISCFLLWLDTEERAGTPAATTERSAWCLCEVCQWRSCSNNHGSRRANAKFFSEVAAGVSPALLSLLKKRRCAELIWCAGRDLNPHGISTTSPSNWRVCHSTTRAYEKSGAENEGQSLRRVGRYLFDAGDAALPGLAGAGAAGGATFFGFTGITLDEPNVCEKILPVRRWVEA